jgi:hypothetical protein
MRRISVGRGAIVAGLLCCVACAGGRGGDRSLTTYTFTTTFDAAGCPRSSRPNVANCGNSKDDCLKIYARDKVKFRPSGGSADPRYRIEFSPASKLTTKPDPLVVADDGKHWDLQVAAETPRGIEHKFSIVSETCPTPLDPTIIIMP